MKPPNVSNVRRAKDPKVLATIMFLPNAAIARNNPEDIWLISSSTRYCLNNLHFRIKPVNMLKRLTFKKS